jgi:hypothetical protein
MTELGGFPTFAARFSDGKVAPEAAIRFVAIVGATQSRCSPRWDSQLLGRLKRVTLYF